MDLQWRVTGEKDTYKQANKYRGEETLRDETSIRKLFPIPGSCPERADLRVAAGGPRRGGGGLQPRRALQGLSVHGHPTPRLPKHFLQEDLPAVRG